MNEDNESAISQLMMAAAFSAHYHRAQRRKGAGDVPYINHPIDVARTLSVDGDIDDVEVIMAALLHDTVEDTEATIEDIRDHFGPRVAQYVAEVTDDKSLPKAERKRRQVSDAPKKSWGAQAIKLADKTCNLRDLIRNPPSNWDRARLYEYALWARAVAEGLRGSHGKLEAVFDQALSEAETAFEPVQPS